MPVGDAKNDKDALSVINDSQGIPFNNQEDIPGKEEAGELKTPKQFQTNMILEELRKKSLPIHQLKESSILTDADKKNMEKIDL